MQKYPIKGAVRSCHKWSELQNLLESSFSKGFITRKSYIKLFHALADADIDDVSEFKTILGKLLKALDGRAV